MTNNEITIKHNLIPTIAPLDAWPTDEEVNYIIADEVEEMAKQLIKAFRQDLQNHNIGYVFKEKASKSGDTVTLGQARSQNELNRVLHGFEGVMVIGFDMWKESTADQKYRLVFHELEHFVIDDKKGGLKVVTHPVEEFPSVIRIFGPATDSQIEFISAYNKFSSDWSGQLALNNNQEDDEN